MSFTPLHKRVSDGVYVHVFYTPVPFVQSGAPTLPANTWIVWDGKSFVSLTDAQYEAQVTVAGRGHKIGTTT